MRISECVKKEPHKETMKKQTLIGITLSLLLGLMPWQPQPFAAAKATVAPLLTVNGWEQKFPAATPSPRVLPAMANIGGDQVLFFGGTAGISFHNDTWVYDLSDNTLHTEIPDNEPFGAIRSCGRSLWRRQGAVIWRIRFSINLQ